jgi:hypothetical protein
VSGNSVGRVEGTLVVVLIVAYVLAFAITRLRRRRPELRIAGPIVAGVAVRLAAVAGISASGLQTQLRGGDEHTFLTYAHILAGTPWGHGFLPHAPYQLHTVLFAAQIKLADLTPGALRITQVGIAMLGVVFLVAAVHDLAGPRAARLAAWLLAFEPASIFFGGALHKEPLMMLASGLVVFGGTKLWRGLNPYGAVICALGGVIAVETRNYAGWFLVSASVLVLLHAALRRLDRPGRAMPVVYAVVIAGFLIAPTLTSVTSNKSLKLLQTSQVANTTGSGQGTGPSNGSNLALERVNFSTRSAVIRNLPQRMYDVTFKPYPWQLQNPSQQLGALGTLVAMATLFGLVRWAWRARGHVFADVAPLFYPWLFLLFAYALSAGNAGTGFRYRTHLVTLALAMFVVLRERVVGAPAEARAPSASAGPTPLVDERAGGTVALDWGTTARGSLQVGE